jgi:hypothetical protein
LADHLADLTAEEERAGRRRTDAESIAQARLGGVNDLAKAMIQQRNLQSWSARAPWATFCLVPLIFLAGAWFVSLLILSSGWHIFLPGADTPFGGHQIYGFANLYFQLGKAIYFGAPLLSGWIIGIIAFRQRLSAVWPMISLVLLAWLGAIVRIRASRSAFPTKIGHISMGLALGSSFHAENLLYALLIFSLAMFPLLILRLRMGRPFSA